jgi:phospholipase C
MPASDNLKQIDTIVIVMMENRSFDHVLGFLSHESYDGRTDVDGLHQHSDDFDWDNPDKSGRLYPPTATPDSYLPCDVPHGRDEVATQLEQGGMKGFVEAYFDSQTIDRTPAPMRFCRPEDIPVTAALARRYLVCDKWFASLPDDTMPNRLMALSGYTRIDSTSGIKPVLDPLPNQHTVFDWLADKGKDFAIYVDAEPIVNLGPPTNLLLMDSQWRHLGRAHTLDVLQKNWQSSAKAPDVIYCEPFYNDFATAINTHGNCNHPPLPMAFGEAFLKRVYIALTSNPQKWAKTMLVICYDEHGGFFDHVTPPEMPYAQPADGTWTHKDPFKTLGMRIPAIIASPLVPRGKTFPGLLDHTSILQLMVDRFGSPADLAVFGDSVNRKKNGVQSLAATLTGTESLTDIVMLDDPPDASGNPTTPGVTNIGSAFRAAIAKAKSAA